MAKLSLKEQGGKKSRVKKKILLVVGARPNFMKVAPVLEALIKNEGASNFHPLLVHTGQHYDKNMSDIFFSDLDMPSPDIFLGVGSGTHAEQTARVMIEMETLINREKPDLLMVAGDVNSTLASSLVAAKAGVRLAHIESGLRSFDRSMPEEINRIVADEFSDFCFVTEPSGLENLAHEGIPKERVFFVGNTMIDSVRRYLGKARERFEHLAQFYGIEREKFALVTLHRPSNVDDKETLDLLLDIFWEMSEFAPQILFPMHPRTLKQLATFNLNEKLALNESLQIIEPIGYLDFLALQDGAAVVLTDSGGIQEETTALKKPCITLRENTERPITVQQGSNELMGLNKTEIIRLSRKAFLGDWKSSSIPELWDGNAAGRIVQILRDQL